MKKFMWFFVSLFFVSLSLFPGCSNGQDTTIISGPTIIGTGTPFGSMSPLEIVGINGGLAITSTNTVPGTESYIAAFLKDASGNYRKIGAEAFQFTDDILSE
jgi:hypothetical protein